MLNLEVDALKKTWDLLDFLPQKEPSRHFTERTLIVKSLKAFQSRGRQTGQARLRTRPEQRGPQQLPVGQWSGLRDDNATGRFLPAARCDLPAELTPRHESKGHGGTQDAFVISKHIIKALAIQVHTLSVIGCSKVVTIDF